jgi:hypothetical protein
MLTLAESVFEELVLNLWAGDPERSDDYLLAMLTPMPCSMVTHLQELVLGDRDRWLQVARDLDERTPVMGYVAAVMSIREDLLADPVPPATIFDTRRPWA